MTERLVIERLEFQGHCGTTEQERSVPQPLGIDLELAVDMSEAAATDDLRETVDYSRVAEQVTAIGRNERFSLLEAFGDRIAQAILAAHPVREVSLWLRKLKPPVESVRGSVGVRMTRQAQDWRERGGPAEWLIRHRHLLRPGRALDLASGQGRNALFLAREGFAVEAWDRDAAALEALQARARARNLVTLSTRLVDLECEPKLSHAAFELVLVFFYLQRELIPEIVKALTPGGVVVYETFLIDNHERFNHPRHREFCLNHNELLALFRGLRVLAYQEGPRSSDRGPFLASLVAQRPS